MIDVARLRALHAVATYGTVTGAARALHLTPSAVSQHLAKLERETGSALLEKDGRGLRLTEAGRVLVRHAATVLAAVEEAEAALAAHRETVTGRLVIAAFPTACRGLAPAALSRLLASHPALEPALREGGNAISLDLVARGEADVAVIDDWPEAPVALPPGLSQVDLGPDVADLVVPAGHALAAGGPVRLADVVGQRWVASTPGSICHDWLTRVLPNVRPAFHVDEFETQLTLVAAGLGVAIVPRLARTYLPAGVAVVPIEPVPTRRVSAAWRTASAARPAISAAVEALGEAWQRRSTG
ncbi:LysR family transcriptional regulator [Luedemannella helvata]|uniref:LysR family transcriptional regulator n=1 Tax=Luedemannella helvata TaxID=349315 RepID=A0ABP4W4A5_9ACTN